MCVCVCVCVCMYIYIYIYIYIYRGGLALRDIMNPGQAATTLALRDKYLDLSKDLQTKGETMEEIFTY